MAEVYLSIGSNIESRYQYIKKAVKEIIKDKSFKVEKCSLIYETDAWGKKDQSRFLNSVLKIRTRLKPENLLNRLKLIEKKCGRKKTGHWAEREIDLDILFYDDIIFKNGFLKIPHPGISKRNFVMVPMNEIAADFIHPVSGKTIGQLLKKSKDKLKVKIYPDN